MENSQNIQRYAHLKSETDRSRFNLDMFSDDLPDIPRITIKQLFTDLERSMNIIDLNLSSLNPETIDIINEFIHQFLSSVGGILGNTKDGKAIAIYLQRANKSTRDLTELLRSLNINEFQKSINDFNQRVKELNEQSEGYAEEIKELKNKLGKELDDFDNRYKGLLQKLEVFKQGDLFEIDADKYRKSSKMWLIGVAISGISVLLCICIIFSNCCFELKCFNKISEVNYNQIGYGSNTTILYFEIVKAVIFRIFIISFLLYILAICYKGYNANRHNYTVNRHKANSLNAALRLLEKSKTPEGNDTLITKAADAIFSHQPTGFSSKDPENITSTITERIVEKASSIVS